MSNRAAQLLARRDHAAGRSTIVNPGNTMSKAHTDALSRAASFRIEADILRERAQASGEPVVREQYLALADRWSTFAASLEAEMMNLSGLH